MGVVGILGSYNGLRTRGTKKVENTALCKSVASKENLFWNELC